MTPRIQSVAGGFSSAQIWRIDAAASFCLRSWPLEHPSPERLAWMHAVLAQAQSRGLGFVPAPVPSDSGRTFFEWKGRLWELTPWMPGVADFLTKPSHPRLENAVRALARFHVATYGCCSESPRQARSIPHPRQPIPGLLDRRTRFAELFSGHSDRLRQEIEAAPASPLSMIARDLLWQFLQLAPRADRELERHANSFLVLQPCIRDIRAEHVLFTGDEVTGLIDYGALRMDTVVGDLVRLLGSLLGNDRAKWEVALAAYSAIRPLLPQERAMIPAWHRASVVLSAANWLDWLFLERRQFPDLAAVKHRLTELRQSLGELSA